MKTKFQELIENYAFQGRDVNRLSKDQLFELTIAYLKNKFSKWPWNNCKADDSIDIEITINMLDKLCSNIYNSQKEVLEEIKNSVIEAQISDVSEALDEEIERTRNRYSNDDREYLYERPVNLLEAFNATKKRVAIYGNAVRQENHV